VRRVLIGVAVVAVLLAAVLFPQRRALSAPNDSPSAQLVVVAQGLAARALSLGPLNAVYLSVLSPANRIFVLGDQPVKDGAALAAVAGTGTAGSLGDGGFATSAEFSLTPNNLYERSGVAIASDGSLYIADTENSTIRRIAGPLSTEPGVVRSVAGKWAAQQNVTLAQPMGIALDHGGDLYIADHAAGVLDVLSKESGVLSSVAQISNAASVAVTLDGSQVFVAAPETGAVFAVDPSSHSIRSVAGLNSQASSSENISPCSTGSNRTCPAGVAVDGAGNLFVSDLTFGRILRVEAQTNAVTSVLTGLQQPGAIAFDQQGRDLFISEQGLNRIVKAAGTGTPLSGVTISPSTFTFANEPTGGISPQQQFTLTNNTGSGISDFQITSPAASTAHTDFALESTSCLVTLAANGSCTANIAFTPTATGPLSSTLNASYSSNGSTQTSSAPVTGTGDDYQLQLASGQLQEISVAEGGTATFNLQVAALGVFGQNGEQVSIFCPSGTPQHSTCTVSPTIVKPTVGSPAPFSVTIATSSSTLQAARSPFGQFQFPTSGSGRVLLIGVLFLLAPIWFLSSRYRMRYLRLTALALAAPALLAGCHHATKIALATPTGAAQILIQGSALAQDGTALNATRAVTVTLDVLLK
jgi:sugar lactone lactonase YvrE